MLRTTKTSTRRKQFKYGGGVDKITQYQWFKDNNIPALEYSTDANQAEDWYQEGHTVITRKLLNSSCGSGIVVNVPGNAPNVVVLGKVYTKYKKKKREFRVHVFKDTAVAVMEKKRRRNFDGQRDTKIRNLANGCVFCQTVGELPEGLSSLAIAASKVTSSDFKGVDIGYNELNKELFVIEVNSAPGIEGSNINKYTQEILNHV